MFSQPNWSQESRKLSRLIVVVVVIDWVASAVTGKMGHVEVSGGGEWEDKIEEKADDYSEAACDGSFGC